MCLVWLIATVWLCGQTVQARTNSLDRLTNETMVLDFQDRIDSGKKRQFYRLEVDGLATTLRVKIHAKQWRGLTAEIYAANSPIAMPIKFNKTHRFDRPKSGQWRVFVSSKSKRGTAFTLTAGLSGGHQLIANNLQPGYSLGSQVAMGLIARTLPPDTPIVTYWYCPSGHKGRTVSRKQRTFFDDGNHWDYGALDGQFGAKPLGRDDTKLAGTYLVSFKYPVGGDSNHQTVYRRVRYSFGVGQRYHHGLSLTKLLEYLETGLGEDSQ